MVNFDKFLTTCGQTVLPDRLQLNMTKIGGKCQNLKIQKFKCDIFSDFQTL